MNLIRYALLLIALSQTARSQTFINPEPDQRFRTDLLVVVAHPDDETVIGSYLARAIFDEHKRVTVVFGTHGGSGGNAQGQEQAGALSEIREIEARRALAHFGVSNVWFLGGIDTAGQDVLRSLEQWNHGNQLGRLVRIVRLTRPTVIATWLPAVSAGENHGNHQAAAVLATEAFDLAGDPSAFAEQTAVPRHAGSLNNLSEGLRPWQPQKLYFFSDTAHPAFLNGKGPSYSAAEISPSRKLSYARLSAEEGAEHLTQIDSGQLAHNALQNGKLGYYQEPSRLILGRSLVPSDTTADVFTGVQPAGIPFQSPPRQRDSSPTTPSASLGGAWLFYQSFWRAHALEHLSALVAPELQVNFENPITIPVSVSNPTAAPLEATVQVQVPAGWEYWRHPPARIAVPAHGETVFSFEARSPKREHSQQNLAPADITIAISNLTTLRLRVEVDSGAMPQ